MKMGPLNGIYLKVHSHYANFFVMIKEGTNKLFNIALNNKLFPSQKKPTKKLFKSWKDLKQVRLLAI